MTPASLAEKPRRGADRTQDVARAALASFCEGGYRLTQIANVSERMGVSVGSIYRTVESKEALFHLAVLEATGALPASLSLPLSVFGMTDSAQHLRRIAAGDGLWSVLAEAVNRPAPPDVRAEAAAIGGQLYDSMASRAPIINLLDRCAHEIPELAEIFDVSVRRKLMGDLVKWVVDRKLVSGPRADVEALARGAMEAVAWLAKNRPGDPTATHITDEAARAAAIRIFVSAFDYGAS